MLLEFTKMHGLGNDFMVIDLITQRLDVTKKLVQKLADVHFGVGFDQLLLVEVPGRPDVDFRYRIFNADGSEVSQCGNGARCFARFVRDRKLTRKRVLRVETSSGIITLQVLPDQQVSVDMGLPCFEPAQIPIQAPHRQAFYELSAAGQLLSFQALSMGNPHMVLQVPETDLAEVSTLGPLLEVHPFFPERVNVGFMQLIDRQQLRLRVWERGTGETLACGTGACAAVVSARLAGLVEQKVKVHLPGGDLDIDYSGEGGHVHMSGPAVRVYEGYIRPHELE